MTHLDHNSWQTRYSNVQDSIRAQQDRECAGFSWSLSFGKFKGKPITAVPTNYLIWLRRKCQLMPIVERCAEEIDRRMRVTR
jgi:hypothetical protein